MTSKNNRNIKTPSFWVYILYCSNGGHYTGYTPDLCRRYQAHLQGIGAKYTRSFRPLYVIWAWPIFGTKSQALKIERFIKKMDKKSKQSLLENPLSLETLFLEYL